MYAIYGHEFLTETFTYHITRQDHRHNFSIYAYQIYLHYQDSITTIVKLLVFLPQFTLVGVMGTIRGSLEMRMFCQTFAFVMLNKVITSQVSPLFLTFTVLYVVLELVAADPSADHPDWQGLACWSWAFDCVGHWTGSLVGKSV
jgi:hypothetical protein